MNNNSNEINTEETAAIWNEFMKDTLSIIDALNNAQNEDTKKIHEFANRIEKSIMQKL